MKRLPMWFSFLLLLLPCMATGAAAALEITGAGATLPSSVYLSWGKSSIGDDFRYEAVGSGNGIELLLAHEADFAASDEPMTPDELERKQLVQFPGVIGAVVPVVNVEGVGPGALKLDGETLARIYLGKITKWNDPAIAALNRDLRLPDAAIAVIYRSDASGSTFIVTNYLSKVSAEWRNTMGEGKRVKWKTGTGGLGNSGAANYMHRLKNSIAYVDLSLVMAEKLSYVQLKNREGQFISPSLASVKNAAANAQWGRQPGFYEILTDQPGNSWPLTGASFVLMHKVQDNPATAQSVLKFFDWGYSSGAQAAEKLNFVSVPANALQAIHAEWKNKLKDAKGNPLW